jgi:hypothetical protein
MEGQPEPVALGLAVPEFGIAGSIAVKRARLFPGGRACHRATCRIPSIKIFTALGVEGVLLVLKFFETLQGFEPTTANPAAFGEGVFAVRWR